MCAVEARLSGQTVTQHCAFAVIEYVQRQCAICCRPCVEFRRTGASLEWGTCTNKELCYDTDASALMLRMYDEWFT